MKINLALHDGKPLISVDRADIAFRPEFVFWQSRLFQLQPSGDYWEVFFLRINQTGSTGSGVPV